MRHKAYRSETVLICVLSPRRRKLEFDVYGGPIANAPMKRAAILLAAGQSSRFGKRDKLTAELDRQPLVLHAAKRIGELHPARKIAVCSVREVGDLLQPLGFQIIFNPEAARGLSSSIARGIEAIGQGEVVDAALICMGDMPFVSVDHLKSLLVQFDAETRPIISSKNGDVAMPPAIFAQRYFETLRTGRGDRGARALLAAACHIAAPAKELFDIDTIDDLRTAQYAERSHASARLP